MDDRKSELAKLCRLEIKRAAALIRMALNGRDLEVADVIDAEFWSMLARLQGKPTTESDLPLLRELVLADLWPLRNELVLKLDVDCNPPPSALTEKIAADIKQLSGRERELLSRFFLEIDETVNGCAAREADIDDYVSGEIERWIRQDLDPSPVTDDDKAWLHGYVRAGIEEEHEGQVSGKTDRGA